MHACMHGTWRSSCALQQAAFDLPILRPKLIGLRLQPYPELEKQPEWTGAAKPDAIDWDKEIAAATQNKEVPEIDWCQPGEDAALEVLCCCCHKKQHRSSPHLCPAGPCMKLQRLQTAGAACLRSLPLA